VSEVSEVSELADRRRRSPWRRMGLVAVAAAAAVVAVAIAVAVLRPADDDVVAEATLEPLVPGVGGDARLVASDGSLELRLSAAGLPTPNGYYEVWLIDPTVSRLVSLGPLRPDGRYEVPAGVDPHAFPIVDVSEEPADGAPTHSGVSVLRSELQFTA
jgi:anti-sigma-K factor RskA